MWGGGRRGAAQTDRSSHASICCRRHGYLEDSFKREGKGRASCEVTPSLPAAPHHLPAWPAAPPNPPPAVDHPKHPRPPSPDVTTGSSFRSGQSRSSVFSLRGLHSGARLRCPLRYQLPRATLPPSSSSSLPWPRQGSATPAGTGATRLLASRTRPSACAKRIISFFFFFPLSFLRYFSPLPSSLHATGSGGSLETSGQGFGRGAAKPGDTPVAQAVNGVPSPPRPAILPLVASGGLPTAGDPLQRLLGQGEIGNRSPHSTWFGGPGGKAKSPKAR